MTNIFNRFIPNKYKVLFDVEDKVEDKNIPALRSAIRSLYPNLKPHTLANFVNFSKKYLGGTVNPQFSSSNAKDVSSMINGIRELSYRSGPQAAKITEMMNAFESMQSSNANEELAQAQGKPTLRFRYDLPGSDDFMESKEQQVLDTTSAQMFNLPVVLPAVGISKLDLDNKRREQWSSSQPLLPRPILGYEAAAPFNSTLYEKQYDASELEILIEDKISDKIAEIHAQNSNINMLQDSIDGHIFIDIEQVPGSFKIDTGFPLAHSWPYMKPDDAASWRQPLAIAAPRAQAPRKTLPHEDGIKQHELGLDTQPLWQPTYDPSTSHFNYAMG